MTAELTIPLVCLFHRLVCFDLPTEHVGKLRKVPVQVGKCSPPDAREVQGLLQKLCETWTAQFPLVRTAQEKVAAIAAFHHQILLIHPFVEGNGRAARALLAQQSLDLFGKADMSIMDRGDAYYRALAAADAGNLKPLEAIIAPVAQG